MTASAKAIVNGAVGFTGMTRATVLCTMDGTAKTVTFTLPNTFIMKGFIPCAANVDGTNFMSIVGITESTGTYTLRFVADAGSAPSAGTYEVILIGEYGRRDSGHRSVSDYTAENPSIGNP